MLQREKARTATALRLYLSSPDWLLSRMQLQEAFKGHAYERRTLGTFDTQKNITVKDLKEWHAALKKKPVVVGAAGSFEFDVRELSGQAPQHAPIPVDLPRTEAPARVASVASASHRSALDVRSSLRERRPPERGSDFFTSLADRVSLPPNAAVVARRMVVPAVLVIVGIALTIIDGATFKTVIKTAFPEIPASWIADKAFLYGDKNGKHRGWSIPRNAGVLTRTNN